MTESKLPELETYIAFRLDQLSARNEHHRFEEIATRVARKRISSNIMVANGPVSAGGDQGRDAESYTTRIPEELPYASGFSASASTSPVVIACTLQRDRLKAKVLGDLESICSDSAAPVGLVAVFSVHSIPEATTHEIQRIAREKYDIPLDIYSGMKIATLLAEPDLVWIAQHYLEVPASMIPVPTEDSIPEWYATLLEALRLNDGPAALTPATQGEITEGLRFATWEADANGDLPEWIDFMNRFLEEELDEQLVFRASYEISVARFRGMGTAGESEDLIRRALNIACQSGHPNVLDDAVTLVTYWGNMWISGVGTATATEISEARERLRLHLTEELSTTDPENYPVRAASLTGALVLIHLQSRWDEGEKRGLRPKQATVAAHVGEKLDDVDFDPSFAKEAGLFQLDDAMSYLEALVELLPRARAFSVSGIAQMFDLFAPALADYPKYRHVRDALDNATAAVHGDAAIAERCRDRGVAFLEASRPLEALVEFHEAKVRWFHGDLMYGAVLVLRYIGKIYRDLGLTFAAKMYAASAAMLANQSPDDDLKRQVPRALLEVARAAQVSGCWIDAAALTEVALLAHGAHEPDAFDFSKHEEIEAHSVNQALELAAIQALWPDREPLMASAHGASDWYEHVLTLASASGDDFPYDEAAFQRVAREQIWGPVLSDLGAQRVIDFNALGVRWTFAFANSRPEVLAAEGFVAAFQVFLADTARFDPVVVSAEIRVEVRPGAELPTGEHLIEFDAANPFRATLTLGQSTADLDAVVRAYIAAAIQLLDAVHARPRGDMHQLLENVSKEGISHKVMVGRPYDETADLLSDDHFTTCASAARPDSSDGFKPHPSAELAASTAPGPDYDRTESLKLITERYRVAQGWQYSLAALLSDARSRDAVAALRADGWLDWQILVTIVNVGLNHRVAATGRNPLAITPQQLRELGTRPEQPADRVLPTEFVLEHLEANLFVQTATVAGRWRLRGPNERPGDDLLRDLLVRRYGFSTDDVPHQDLLDALGPDGTLKPLLPKT